jgi:hypothetical protein
MYSINIWAVLVASLVSFGLGSFWYSPFLFGKEWMELTGNKNDPQNTKGVWKHYLVHFVFTVVSFTVLGFIASVTGLQTSADGAFIAFIIWLGFTLPLIVSELLWRKIPFKLALIDGIFWLITLVIGGGIIGAWV